MKAAIMQPYFFPYIGYFQLIAAVDLFIVYDNIKYTKKGWINRNRILYNGADEYITVPLKKDSDSLDVRDRQVSADFNPQKLLARLTGAYGKAPYFNRVSALLEQTILHRQPNLFGYLHHNLIHTCRFLGIETEIRVSSTIAIDHHLKSQDKVLALCKEVGADVYINPIGGLELYEREVFARHDISLRFLKARPHSYRQLNNDFVPWLSIIDVLMFNPPEEVDRLLREAFDIC